MAIKSVCGMVVSLMLLAATAKASGGDQQVVYLDSKQASIAEADDSNAEEISDPEVQSGPQPLPSTQLMQAAAPAPAMALQPWSVDAHNAKQAAKVAKKAAKVANKVAKHAMKITGHAKKSLTHALGALHDARVDSAGLGKQQKEKLKKAEAHLREATKKADFGKLKSAKDAQDLQREQMEAQIKKGARGQSEREQMRREIQELRKQLKEKNIDDKDINQALDELEADLAKTNGPINDESKAELERLRQLVDSLEAQEDPKKVQDEKDEKVKQDMHMKPLEVQKDDGEKNSNAVDHGDGAAVPVQEKGFDIDTAMPYGDLEPFGREDTAQELTESSIKESDEMVDQLERAEVAEEKRSVFRALTRLRGAAITSYDGVARSQTGNIDEYNKINKWRPTHPLHHLADEESDVSKWAFPDNAD